KPGPRDFGDVLADADILATFEAVGSDRIWARLTPVALQSIARAYGADAPVNFALEARDGAIKREGSSERAFARGELCDREGSLLVSVTIVFPPSSPGALRSM